MQAGKLRYVVSCWKAPTTTPDTDGFLEALDPPRVWAAIDAQPPNPDGRTVTHLVTMRFHPQITMDSMLLFGSRQLFVRGVQNVENADTELRLLCEEIIP